MFTGRLPIEAIFLRLLEACFALLILDSAAQGITLGGVLLAMLVVAVMSV